ncbi:hypothetical protein [Castellaniella sp.]|uniref:hypothetical protein n=1 Tax=Castellaniella sp. TaxID=1955812 RepID=UPI002AFF443E|nr:hypothetical protein [Castellaniella sp.]
MPQFDEYSQAQVDQMRDIGNALLNGADAIEQCFFLQKQVDEWRAKYVQLLDDDLKHSQEMVGQTLKGLLAKTNED